MAGLRTEGFSDEATIASYKAFTSFLLGHLMLEVAMTEVELGRSDVVESEAEQSDSLARFPLVRALRANVCADRSAAEFEDSLENLLKRLARVRQQYP